MFAYQKLFLCNFSILVRTITFFEFGTDFGHDLYDDFVQKVSYGLAVLLTLPIQETTPLVLIKTDLHETALKCCDPRASSYFMLKMILCVKSILVWWLVRRYGLHMTEA